MSVAASAPSVNAGAMTKVSELLANASDLGIAVSIADCGATVIDMGLTSSGSMEAGRLYAEATMGGLGTVSFGEMRLAGHTLTTVEVTTDWPVEACWVAQKHAEPRPGDPDDVILAGPAKALLTPPDACVTEARYQDSHHQAVAPLQLERPPTDVELVHLATACGLDSPADLYVLFAPTASLVCAIQVAARSIDNAMHRLHSAGVGLYDVEGLQGSAPLPPPSTDTTTALGRINDSLMYGSQVHAMLDHPSDFKHVLAQVTRQPEATRGRPFLEIFAAAGHDFHNVPLDVFCIAELSLENFATGEIVKGGHINEQLLVSSFYGDAMSEPPHSTEGHNA